MPDGSPWPRISIVTPSYNKGRFIEETIRSVLLQGYPELEYIIMDGGSTDGTAQIIQKYRQWLAHYESGPDGGQAAAVNKGFAFASGAVRNWLNADDLLGPSALPCIGRLYRLRPGADLICGTRLVRTVDGESGLIVDPVWQSAWRSYLLDCGIFPQEATYFSQTVHAAVGALNESSSYIFDVIFFAAALKRSRRIVFTNNVISIIQSHGDQKTRQANNQKSSESKLLCAATAEQPLWQRLLVRMASTRFSIVVLEAYRHWPVRKKRPMEVISFDWTTGSIAETKLD
jgi:glycosyltransferase involved in cell wall biosynthesis